MENFNYVFSLSADRSDDSDGKMKVHIKYDDASGIGVNLNREFDEDSYQQGISDMLEDLETQLTNAVTAKSLRDAVQEEPEEKDEDPDRLSHAIDHLQDRINRLERKISLMEMRKSEDESLDPIDPRYPHSRFGKIWC